MFRFIHSSDLHIGKRFGTLPEDLRGRLREARHGAIARLAEAARAQGAETILLAGDTFDTETPTPAVLRQAIAEMGRHAPLRWVLLPGNHDSLLADQLWAAAGEAAPTNVTIASRPEPIALASDVLLLPAPCTTRRPGRDLSEWMDGAASTPGMIRIGLAHGPILDFSEDSAGADVIAPDRAQRAGLDYLALGDWHGPMAVNPRSYYSGTPEPDRFKHDKPGEALAVTIEGPGAVPHAVAVATGSFAWRIMPLHLLAGEDAVGAMAALLPDPAERRQTLLRIAASGRTQLAGRTGLTRAAEAAAPDFAFFELLADELVTDCEPGDLETIDAGGGALRQAAQALLDESGDATRSAEERDVARAALIRIFGYAEAAGA